MDYISFPLHMSLTIKHKGVLGAKGLLGLYKIRNMEAVVRASASQPDGSGCHEKLNLRGTVSLPPSLQVSLCLQLSLHTVSVCLSLLVGLPIYLCVPATIWMLKDRRTAHLPAAEKQFFCLENDSNDFQFEGRKKSVAGVTSLQGQCCLLWLFSKEMLGLVLRWIIDRIIYLCIITFPLLLLPGFLLLPWPPNCSLLDKLDAKKSRKPFPFVIKYGRGICL